MRCLGSAIGSTIMAKKGMPLKAEIHSEQDLKPFEACKRLVNKSHPLVILN